MAKKEALKKRKVVMDQGGEAAGDKKKPRMWWEDELDGQRVSARDGPEEDAAYFREEVRWTFKSRIMIQPSHEAALCSVDLASVCSLKIYQGVMFRIQEMHIL